jgi:hypothetical protein
LPDFSISAVKTGGRQPQVALRTAFMAETQKPEETPGEKPKLEPISPVVRKRLQACYQQGAKVSNSGNYDYATEMFSQCVVKDPAQKLYLDSFLDNLKKKYNNNKKGQGGLSGFTT